MKSFIESHREFSPKQGCSEVCTFTVGRGVGGLDGHFVLDFSDIFSKIFQRLISVEEKKMFP